MSQSRILVVDSSAVSREIVTRILLDVIEGTIITTCNSGAEALEALSENHYSLVTTSLLLSDMDGMDLCRRLRDSYEHQHTPVVVISGDADERLQQEGFSAGVTDFFDKSQGYPAFGPFIKRFYQRNNGQVGRILYIEDSKTAATMTMRMMERHGLDITHVLSAEEGLRLMQQMHDSDSHDFDMVVTDLYLEGEMTGRDLLHILRGRFHFSSQALPVLMITGNDDLKTQVEAFHAGANDFVHKPLIEEVLMARIRSLLMIKHQYDALECLSENMQEVASTDTLTGVKNRHYMREHGEKMFQAAGRKHFWVMIIDIDHLRQINDEQGPMVGDHVLAVMGTLLRRFFGDAMVVRFGGEEFAVMLSESDRAEVVRRAEALRTATEELRPEGIKVTVSIGLAGIDEHPGNDLNGLIGVADKALLVAKENGRNQVCVTQSCGTIDTVNRLNAVV